MEYYEPAVVYAINGISSPSAPIEVHFATENEKLLLEVVQNVMREAKFRAMKVNKKMKKL